MTTPKTSPETSPTELTIFTDGGSRGNPGPAGIGVVVFDGAVEPAEEYAGQTPLHEHADYMGTATNNEAEYAALASAVEWLTSDASILDPIDLSQLQKVHVYLDSKLVVEQINGNWKIKQPHLRKAVDEIQAMMQHIDVAWHIEHVRREKNSWADMLVNTALDAAAK